MIENIRRMFWSAERRTTVAGFALAQFAAAYSLVAQFGLYLHEGHGQIVKSLTELINMF